MNVIPGDPLTRQVLYYWPAPNMRRISAGGSKWSDKWRLLRQNIHPRLLVAKQLILCYNTYVHSISVMLVPLSEGQTNPSSPDSLVQSPTPAAGLKLTAAMSDQLRALIPIRIETDSPVFAKVSESIQKPEWILEAANAQSSEAYPSQHRDFGWSEPEMVGANTAGIFATDAAAVILSVMRECGNLTGSGYLNALNALKKENLHGLSPLERFVVQNVPHMTWRVSQVGQNIERLTLTGYDTTGTKTFGPCWANCNNLGGDAWSRHRRVVNMVFADGSVRTVKTDASITVIAALITKDGGETPGDF